MLKYFKAAFTSRWNLLALFGGVGAAVISGSPDVILPLVLAAEAAYLALVGSHAKFQNYVDIQEHTQTRATRSQRSDQVLKHILRSLPRPLTDRYTRLRENCLNLQRIAADLKRTGDVAGAVPFESMQVESLDRLLWLYLRLLFTYHALGQFLGTTSRERMEQDVRRIEKRLANLQPEETSSHAQKVRRALEDHLTTSQDRIRNYDRARANFEFVELEIDRLENKIKSLAEVAVNRQEPDYVSNQVDQVATSMLETEKTMNDLQVFTGLEDLQNEVPMLLETNRVSSR
ncbi:MAG: hypothetical protein ACYC6N_14080 [Pirellulaceae bacterium]